jgi:hypothetical protein
VGSTNNHLFHVTDIMPTLLNLVGASTSRNLPLDGFDMMPAVLDPAKKDSARKEMLYNINGACFKGFVGPKPGPISGPAAAVRVGEMKLLVDCFNITTKAPYPANSPMWLHNLTADPSEEHNLAADPSHASTLSMLIGRLAAYAASTDQYPPTLFPEEANHTSCAGQCPVWNFQCPQCPQGGAFPSKDWPKNGTTAPNTFNPWCDDVKCIPTDPAVLAVLAV